MIAPYSLSVNPIGMPRCLASALSPIPGRLVALLVFLTGVGILIFVFVTALHLFQSPVPGLALPVAAGTTAPPAVNIGAALAQFARDLLLLGVMTLIGSLLASKGAHLYFGTVYPVHETPAKEPTPAKK